MSGESIVVDVNKAQVGTIYPDCLASLYLTKCDVFEKMIVALESQEDISAGLKSEMEDFVKQYTKTNRQPYLNALGSTEIEKASNVGPDEFQMEQIVATALQAISNGKEREDIKKDVDTALQKMKAALVKIFEKDITRPGRVITVNDKIINIDSTKDLQNLVPELTGEQIGYLQTFGHQGVLTNSWSVATQELLALKQKVASSGDNILLNVIVKDGKVQLVSSIDIQIIDPERDMGEQKRNPTDVIRVSSIIDITHLKGQTFQIGRATGDVPMTAVYSDVKGDNKELLSELVNSQFSNPDQSLKHGKASGVNSLIDYARTKGIPVQKAFSTGSKDGIKERNDQEIKKRRDAYQLASKAIDKFLGAAAMYASLEQDPQRRSEFAARKIAEYIQDKGGELGINDPAINNIASPLLEHLSALKLASEGSNISIKAATLKPMRNADIVGYNCALESLAYSSLEPDPNKRVKYASSKVLEYTTGAQSHSKESVSAIVSTTLPFNTKIQERDADMILRATQESKDLPLKERLMKLVDKVRISVGLVSQDIAQVATQVKDDRKAKRKSFVEELRQDRAVSMKRRGREI